MSDEISQQELNENYQYPWEAQWLSSVDADLNPVTPGSHKRIFNYISQQLQNPQHLLDIGCGVGLLSIKQAKNHPQLYVTSLDISKSQLNMAVELAQKHGVTDRVQFVNASAEALPLADIQPDFIVMTEVLEHLLEPDQALQHIRRISSPNTQIILSVPQIYGEGGSGIFYRQVEASGEVIVHTQNPDNLRADLPVLKYYHAEFSPKSIRTLLKHNGFVIEEMIPITFKIPIWRQTSHESNLTKWTRRAHNGLSRLSHNIVLHSPDAIDRMVSGLRGGRWAKNLIVRCRVDG
jgi:ubiquinone/menaquinone biosynthesis C-methylase UbiE